MTNTATPFPVLYTLLLTAAAFVLFPSAQTARAQLVPVTTIENADGDTVLVSYENGNFAVGTSTTANGDNGSVAMGNSTTASGNNALAVGLFTEATALRATAMGNSTIASGTNATAMGLNTEAATDNSLTIGYWNSQNIGTGNENLFVVGNGSDGDRSDALYLRASGNLTISGSLTENSDRRLKKGIEPLSEDVLEKVGEIRPVRFRFKNEQTHPSGEQIGLIAQEMQAQFPELVNGSRSGHLSVSYTKFTAVLLKAVQEQQAQFEKQQARIEKQQEQIAALQAQQSSGVSLAGLLPIAGLLLGGCLLVGGVVLFRRQEPLG